MRRSSAGRGCHQFGLRTTHYVDCGGHTNGARLKMGVSAFTPETCAISAMECEDCHPTWQQMASTRSVR